VKLDPRTVFDAWKFGAPMLMSTPQLEAQLELALQSHHDLPEIERPANQERIDFLRQVLGRRRKGGR
jgi:hypothetical protein